MGKWGKYSKKFIPKWLKEPALKGWLEPTAEKDLLVGKPEAYCKLCRVHIRAHHSDLIHHSSSKKHRDIEKSLMREKQPSLHDHGCYTIKDDSKILDLRLAVYVASHSSIKSIEHLTDLLKELGKGSPLENVRLHRTKCTKLLTNVVAPAFLRDLVRDVGDGNYSLILDEATDVATCKFLGICIRYFSTARKRMVTDFLGIVEVESATGEALADAVKSYLKDIKLRLKNLHAVGTDGASNMCGRFNSFYTHMKKDVPGLLLLKCTCHSLHKCVEYAFHTMPDTLSYLLSETHNWFGKSSNRLRKYSDYYMTLNSGQTPRKIQPLSDTRWLVWVPVAEEVVAQWYELRGFFALLKCSADFKARTLAELYADDTNLLYLTFLKTVLRGVHTLNLSFESSEADVTKLYSDMRTLVFSLVRRILSQRAIASTTRPGPLRNDEVEMLTTILNDPDNQLPVDRVNLGENFDKCATKITIAPDALNNIRRKCGEFIFKLCKQLLQRMPSNLDAISQLKFLSPRLVLAHVGRPTFHQTPVSIADPAVDIDVLSSQWLDIGSLPLSEICLHDDMNSDIDTMDAVHFWSCVMNLRNAGGTQIFKELALYALKALCVPISNAVVERVFSVMACVKTKLRNRMQLKTLDSLLRLRTHLKVDGLCCSKFTPSREMISNFNSTMYVDFHEPETSPSIIPGDGGASNNAARAAGEEDLEEEDFDNIIKMFDATDL